MSSLGKKIFVATILVVIAASVQLMPGATVFGIRPNFILATIISIGFFITSPITFAFLVLFGGALLRFSPGPGLDIIILTIALFFSYWLKGRIVWPGLLTNVFLTFFATALFYLGSAPTLFYTSPFLIVTEGVLNVFFAMLVYEGFLLRYGETRSTI